MALLLQRSPLKHECEISLVQQVEGDDLALEIVGSGQVVASIEHVLAP